MAVATRQGTSESEQEVLTEQLANIRQILDAGSELVLASIAERLGPTNAELARLRQENAYFRLCLHSRSRTTSRDRDQPPPPGSRPQAPLPPERDPPPMPVPLPGTLVTPSAGDEAAQEECPPERGMTRRRSSAGAGDTAEPHYATHRRSSQAVSTDEGAIGKELERQTSHRPLFGAKTGVFADAATMKERVRKAIHETEYDVKDFYKDEGIAQQLARSHIFDNVTLFLIGINSVWIAIEADHNHAPTLMDSHPVFAVVENVFCLYFTGEWLIRLLSFRKKRDGLKDKWFIFDGALMAMMILETWVMTLVFLLSASSSQDNMFLDPSFLRIFRLLRLTRVARMVRVVRALPELMVLIKGMSMAMRSVCLTLILLVVIIYVFAIAFRQITSGTDAGGKYFKSVPDSMVSLLLGATIPDLGDIVKEVSADNIIFGLLLLLFILIATLTGMNMLVGLLVEVVSVVASVEREQLNVNYVRSRLLHMIKEFEPDESPETLVIEKEDFQMYLSHPKAARVINDVGVDVMGLVDLQEYIFKDGSISFPVLIETVLSLRGSNQATVKDVVDLRKFVHTELREMTSYLQELTGSIVKCSSTLPLLGKAQRAAQAVEAPSCEPKALMAGQAPVQELSLEGDAAGPKPPSTGGTLSEAYRTRVEVRLSPGVSAKGKYAISKKSGSDPDDQEDVPFFRMPL